MNRIALLALLILAPAAWSQEDEITGHEKFQLWRNCLPMNLSVRVSEDAAKINLTKQDVETAVRSRLRAARLYDGEATIGVEVLVNVAGEAVSFSLAFYKPVKGIFDELFYLAPTWETGQVGIHGQNPSFILAGISKAVDLFIDEYLRVNESDCSK